jgi:hypothetical protein
MPVHTIALVVAVGLLCLASIRAVVILYKYHGRRVITCPENRRPAGVELDIRRVLSTSLVSAPRLRLSSCSRWPERAGCGQECLSQIEAGPEGCLVRTILADWYAGKKCVFCGQPFGDIQWSVQKPALLVEGQVSTDCSGVPAERLPDVLAAAKPVCFACHTATKWVREHPDLVVDRSSKTQSESR